ncbi:Putative callose synthase 6 [Rhizoctonia solani]|uniref:Putative callose synthase 6 n=1 Tax=Rhizoctonia solani TaxID=456999 RepID=A0A0K6FXS0_9AGAM|nr:Putative callose synthase 6 [Rhizoctonia solani]
MASPQSRNTDQYWGRTIQDYPIYYSWESLTAAYQVPVDEASRAIGREVALRTIEQISTIAHPSVQASLNTELVHLITLEKLQHILELPRYPGELDNFALPGLVAGCITLMSTVKPSPFHYEYGYVCFRIMVIALNTCLLKHGRDPNEALQIPNAYFPTNYLADLWRQTAFLLLADLQGRSEVFPEMPNMRLGPQALSHLEAMRLDVLLDLLHGDQKNFSILLKEFNSLGLSGLMYVLSKFVEKNKADMNKERYQDRFLIPFTRIFYRYRLLVPDFTIELQTVKRIHNAGMLVGEMCGKPPNADLEDSRNIMEAFSRSMGAPEPTRLPDCLGLMNYASKFVMPGCEDLVGKMGEAAIQVVWNFIPAGQPDVLMQGLALLLKAITIMFDDLNLSRIDKQPWMDSLLDSVFEADIMSLLLRLALLIPTLCSENPECRLDEAIQEFVEILEYVPRNHLRARFLDSGTLRLWRKYLLYFGSSNLLSPSKPNAKHEGCSYIITSVCQQVLASQWAGQMKLAQPIGVCGNPRCPILVGAELSCSKQGTTYCDARCQGFDQMYGSPMSPGVTETLGSTNAQVKAPKALFDPLIYAIKTIWPDARIAQRKAKAIELNPRPIDSSHTFDDDSERAESEGKEQYARSQKHPLPTAQRGKVLGGKKVRGQQGCLGRLKERRNHLSKLFLEMKDQTTPTLELQIWLPDPLSNQDSVTKVYFSPAFPNLSYLLSWPFLKDLPEPEATLEDMEARFEENRTQI